jgi:hypothetical protein
VQRQELNRLMAPPTDERDKDAARKRAKRSKSAEITIPKCANPARRQAALADAERFLLTYFADRYTIEFGPHHKRMIAAIVECAKHGLKQAIAAPRGCGKSEIVKGLNVYLVLAGIVRFPVIIAATGQLARRLFQDFRQKIATNDLLFADFPEVCAPVRALEGAPQRAARQHVNGELTHIVWTSSDYVRLPDVPGSPYGGVKMTYFGLDSAFRGCNIDGDRPDFGIIDDPETEESARSEGQISDRENKLDKDIAGLKSQDGRLGLAMLTTVQNTICLSYRYTDRNIKPAWNGFRLGLVVKWPTNMDLWNDYIAIRQKNQADGDQHGREAVEFYLNHQAAMELGAEMLTPHFVPSYADGHQLVYSSLQAAFDQIAATSIDAFRSEYQNDPTPEDAPDTVGLTAGKVASRISGLRQGEYHEDSEHVTVGIDIGKYYSHWCKIAWWGNAVGNVIDYGVMETPGMIQAVDAKGVMAALLPALHQWRSDILADGKLDFCFIDSGDYSDAVYEFVRQVGGTPFAAAKGWDSGRFRQPKEPTNDKKPFNECYAARLPAERIWLYHVHTEYWKQWLQERFVTATFNDQQQFNDGSLSLFAHDDRKKHLSYSHHIVAEERRDVFVKDKGIVRKWVVVNRNNHYLDATALACAAAGCLGVRIIPKTDTARLVQPTRQPTRPAVRTPHGQPFLATERR